MGKESSSQQEQVTQNVAESVGKRDISPADQPGSIRMEQSRQGTSDSVAVSSVEDTVSDTEGELVFDAEVVAALQAQTVENSKVYEASALRGCYVERKYKLLGGLVLIIVAVVIGVSVAIGRPPPSDPSASGGQTQEALAWIANSTVEQVAMILPADTVKIIWEEMKPFLKDNSTSQEWYSNKLWADASFRPFAAQAQAWQWLVSSPSNANYSQDDVLTRYVLAILYHSTSGDLWTNRTYWLDPQKSVCDWFTSLSLGDAARYAAYLEACRRDGFQELNLKNNGLVGFLPNELGLLPVLTSLTISDADLSGPIPETLADLDQLETLDLSGARLNGTIPSFLGNLSQLSEIQLTGDFFSGTLPQSLNQLSNMQVFSVQIGHAGGYTNYGTFMLSALVSNWPKLSLLRVWVYSEVEAYFEATKALFNSMTKLHTLELANMVMDGKVLSRIHRLSSLHHLDLTNCGLEGSLPTSLQRLSQLQYVGLVGNSLRGSLSSQYLESLSQIEYFWIAGNSLTGTIPSAIGSMTDVKEFYVYDNLFIGTLPTEVAGMTQMTALGISYNQLTGSLPTEIAKLTQLDSVNLQGTLINVVPPELCERSGFVVEQNCDQDITCDCCECLN